LSIIVPCSEDGELFESTLVSVLQHRPPDCEVLVSHAGPYRDPYDLEGEVRFVEARRDASLLELINAGWMQAGGEVIHVLQCGSQVKEGWTDCIWEWFEKPAIGSVSPALELIAESTARRRIAGLRHGLLGRKLVPQKDSPRRPAPAILGPTLTAGFYRRTALEEVGGFDVLVGDRNGDLDIALSLEAAGYDAANVASSCVTAADAERQVVGFGDARRLERVFWKHLPKDEGRGSVLGHLIMVAVEFLFPFPGPRSALRLLGRLIGSLEPRLARRTRSVACEQPAAPESAVCSDTFSSADRPQAQQRRRVVA
jgi:hypothetical protein